jgi:hypothetical protein
MTQHPYKDALDKTLRGAEADLRKADRQLVRIPLHYPDKAPCLIHLLCMLRGPHHGLGPTQMECIKSKEVKKKVLQL